MNYKNTILIVDDDRALRLLLGNLLNRWGYEVFGADDGSTAIEKIRKRPFDLVLMDIHMRKISGLEALAEIKSYNPRIPVIIMTALASVEYAAEAQKKGASDFLPKPFDPDGLRKALSRALDNLSLKVHL
jgi:two-component system response regulator HydG